MFAFLRRHKDLRLYNFSLTNMFALFKKEINSFLSSLTGYIVIAIFLLLTGLFLWVFPSEFNIVDGGYASLDSLFILAPWVFMFLIPAVTMRTFSEEFKNGTIELLLTKPISDFQLIFAKYLAGLVLVIVALLPTLIYYGSVYYLGATPGNLDQGGTWGSYLGLLFLAGSFVSIGIFASSISSNQVVAFLVAVFFTFIFYIGFELLGSFELLGTLDSAIINLGINEHYLSLSRGVVDSRDVLYFLGLAAFFLFATRLVIKSRKW
jgi:ABC-2 type transport system permease protein